MDVVGKRFQKQMGKLANNLDDWYGASNLALQTIAIRDYYDGFSGSVILDVGNGGVSAEEQLGPDLAKKVARFIGADKSIEMLYRDGTHEDILRCSLAPVGRQFCRLLYVEQCTSPYRAQKFRRVWRCRFRCLEGMSQGCSTRSYHCGNHGSSLGAAIRADSGQIVRRNATFVFHAEALPKLIRAHPNIEIRKLKSYGLGELVGNWTLFRGMIILPIKIPAGLIPYTYVFCEVRKPELSSDRSVPKLDV